MIRFEHVRKTFVNDDREVHAVQDLSFDIATGEYVCILGRSGCGKSTTLNLLLGLTPASGGNVRVLGHDPFAEFPALRGRIGCIFQNDRLLPWRTALDNVRLPLEILGRRDLIDEAPRWLERLGLAGFEQAFPHQLSGGMRQRVAIARALASPAELLLADEAFGHLDEAIGAELRRDFRRLAKERGATVIHITHSIDEALSIADRILVFARPGRVATQIDSVDRLDAVRQGAVRTQILQQLRSAA